MYNMYVYIYIYIYIYIIYIYQHRMVGYRSNNAHLKKLTFEKS